MKLDEKLVELANRRSRFKDFRDSVDADLAKQRAERLAGELSAIRGLILESAAMGATTGQIKRAYGTKDHRTVADVIRDGAAEIDVIRKSLKSAGDRPKWITSSTGDTITVKVGDDTAVYTWQELEDGKILFLTEESEWDESFTVRNKAVELLDGKMEDDSDEARSTAKFIRGA